MGSRRHRRIGLCSLVCAFSLVGCFGKGFDLSGDAGHGDGGRDSAASAGGAIGPSGTGGAAPTTRLDSAAQPDVIDAPMGEVGAGTGGAGGSGLGGSGGAGGGPGSSGGTSDRGGTIASSGGDTGSSGGAVVAGGTSGASGGPGTGGSGPACTNTQTDPKNCGACGFDCSALENVKAGAAPPDVQCAGGVCVVQPSACMTGFGHCSNNANDGCETDLTSVSNCGTCNKACAAPLGICSTKSSPASCVSSCAAPTPDLCGSTCVDTTADPKHCGSCSRDCTTLPNLKPGAAVECKLGQCVIPAAACATGFANCTTTTGESDGCETATTTLRDCGGCGVPCSFPNGTASCATGTCTLQSCATDYKPCNGSCIPASQCCVDADCPQARANACVRPVCSNHTCSFVAQSGSCPAGGTCQVSTSTCTRAPVSAGSYNIDATEVTRGQYLAFVQAKGSNVSGQPAYCAWNTSYQPAAEWPPTVADYDLPVTWVDWCDAYAYCSWAGRRLCGKIGGGSNLPDDYDKPALSQWMQACVGASNTAYPYGNTFSATRCNGPLLNNYGPIPVGQASTCTGGYPGLFDMSGNVWEWEDACSGTTGGSDLCRERGSSYVSTRDDASGIFMQCDANNNNARQLSDGSVGFRCCGG